MVGHLSRDYVVLVRCRWFIVEWSAQSVYVSDLDPWEPRVPDDEVSIVGNVPDVNSIVRCHIPVNYPTVTDDRPCLNCDAMACHSCGTGRVLDREGHIVDAVSLVGMRDWIARCVRRPVSEVPTKIVWRRTSRRRGREVDP